MKKQKEKRGKKIKEINGINTKECKIV